MQSKSAEGVKVLQGFVSDIWTQLFRHTECIEEGTRNVVAECLGKLTLINPSALLPKLQESLKTDSPMMRTTIVTAIKFTISDQVRLERYINILYFVLLIFLYIQCIFQVLDIYDVYLQTKLSVYTMHLTGT